MSDKVIGTVAAVALTLALQGEPLRFYDVVPYSPGEEATVVSDILRTHCEAGLDTFLYSVSLDPRGKPAKANVVVNESIRRDKSQIDGLRRFSHRLEGLDLVFDVLRTLQIRVETRESRVTFSTKSNNRLCAAPDGQARRWTSMCPRASGRCFAKFSEYETSC